MLDSKHSPITDNQLLYANITNVTTVRVYYHTDLQLIPTYTELLISTIESSGVFLAI